MKNAVKWIGGLLISLVGITVLAGLVVYFASERRINRVYKITVEPIAIPTDAVSIEEGRRQTAIRGCGASDCHGHDFGGGVLLDDPMIGHVYGPNLTSGEGSATAGYSTKDWVRSVRHGVDPDGRPLLIMPSSSFTNLSDEDVGRIIAYIQSVPPVEHLQMESRLGPVGYVLHLTDQAPLPVLSAEVIDHSVTPPKRVVPEVSTEFGRYMIAGCMDCHRENLSGGPIPGSLPGEPPAANLTPAGNLAHWTYEGFANTLRTGVTPDGKVLDPSVMPWTIALEMTDTELEAMWLYLTSLPPVTTAP